MNNFADIFSYKNTNPNIAEDVFLAPGVKIIGDVTIGKYSSIWYNSVVRGDVHYVKIGEYTNIQDLSMLHVTNSKYPLNIGNNVTIGHSVKLHGCTIQDYSFLGIGSIVLDGAVVNSNSLVGAGAVVKENFTVPSGVLVAGVPAKIIRDLNDDEINNIKSSAKRYYEYSQITVESLTKSENYEM